MTCREFTEFLDRYLSDAMPPEERAQFDRHLGACKDCRNYLATYEQTVELEREALREDEDELAGVPSGLLEAVMASVTGQAGDR